MNSKSNERRLDRQAAFFFIAILPFSIVVSADRSIARAEPRLDFARIVPGDADFFIEVHELERIRESFRALGIWNLMRGIAETGGPTTQPWQRRSEQLLGMSSEQMIERVLGRRAALFSKQSDDWQNGILIAEVESPAAVKRLLRIWNARPLSDEGIVRRYRLRGSLICAAFDRILVIGPEEDPDGLLGRSILLLAGKTGPHLAGQSAFASLRSRLPEDSDAVLFARWPSDYRYAFADCERVMASVRHSEGRTHCDIVGRLRRPTAVQSTLDPTTFEGIPNDAMACWMTARIQPPARDDALDLSRGPSGLVAGLKHMLPDWFANSMQIDTLANGDTSLYLTATDTGELQFPAICVRQSTTQAAALQKSLESVFGIFAGLVDIFSRPTDVTAKITAIERDDTTNPPTSHLPIGKLLARRKGAEFLGPLELVWAATADCVVVGTDRGFVRNTIAASTRSNEGNRARQAIATLASDRSNQVIEAGQMDGRAVAEMTGTWLSYLDAHHPYATDDAWWQLWAMGKLADQSRLGVALRDDPDNRGHAIVAEIDPFAPAAGRLTVGDAIVSAANRRLSKSQPSRSVAERYEARGSETRFDLIVIRNEKRVEVSIPVPPVPEYRLQNFRPIAAIRLLRTLLQCVDSAAYVRIAEDPAYLNLRFDILWAKNKNSPDQP